MSFAFTIPLWVLLLAYVVPAVLISVWVAHDLYHTDQLTLSDMAAIFITIFLPGYNLYVLVVGAYSMTYGMFIHDPVLWERKR